MTIYLYGCNCGINGINIRRVKTLHPTAEVINTKYDREALTKHLDYLKELDVNADRYPAVVVDGPDVVELSRWKP